MSNIPTVAQQNLLFGLLAYKNNLVSREQLIEAIEEWTSDRSRSLSSIVVNRNWISNEEQDQITGLSESFAARHNGNISKTLNSLTSMQELRLELEQLVEATEATRSTINDADMDANATQAFISNTTPADFQGRFRILRPHASGNLGQVFVARDEELGREVALKEIQVRHANNIESRRRFIVEAEVTGGLEHPGIVPVYGMGKYADGRPYYAMRFIRGDSLKQAIEEFYSDDASAVKESTDRAVELRKLLQRFIDVCNAIEYAHSRGVLHRDLKPGNIMLGKFGETMVVDWGLAKAAVDVHSIAKSSQLANEPVLKTSSGSDAGLTVEGSIIGTPAFASPEQIVGRIDLVGATSDVYSLGATLYQIITGKPPFAGSDFSSVLSDVQKGRFPTPRSVRRDVPIGLEAICLKAMSLEPSARYPSAKELAEDLERWLADEPVLARKETSSERLSRLTRRHRAWTQAGAAALVLIATSGILAAIFINSARQREVTQRERADQLLVDVQAERDRANQAFSEEANQRAIAESQRLSAERQQQIAEAERYRAEQALQQAERASEKELLQVAKGIIEKAADKSILLGGTDITSSFLDARRVLQSSNQSTFLVDAILSYCFERHPLPLTTYRGHSNKVYTVIISPDGLLAATGSLDRTVRVWNVATGETLLNLTEHETRTASLSFSPDGKRLLTGDGIGKLILWSIPTGEILREWKGHREMVRDGVFSHDGERIVTSSEDDQVNIWNATSGDLITSIENCGANLVLSKDGKRVLAARRTLPAISIVEIASGDRKQYSYIKEQFDLESLESIAWSPDETHAIVGTIAGEIAALRLDGSQGVVYANGVHQHNVFGIAFAPDGKRFVTSSVDKNVQLWSYQASLNGHPTIAHIQTYSGHDETVVSVAWVPGSNRFISTSLDGTAKTWLASNSQAMVEIQNKTNSSFVYEQPMPSNTWLSPHNEIMISQDLTSLKCFDVFSGRQLAALDLSKLRTPSATDRVMYSPSGIAFGSGNSAGSIWLCDDQAIYKWSLLTNDVEPVVPLSHAAKVHFDNSQNRAIVSLEEGTEIWDLESRNRIGSLLTTSLGACFAPDGGSIAIFDEAKKVSIYRVDSNMSKVGKIWTIDPGARWTRNDSCELDWKGDRILVNAGGWTIPATIDLTTGVAQSLVSDRVSYSSMRLSPDGNWMYGNNSDSGDLDIWNLSEKKCAWSCRNRTILATTADKICFSMNRDRTVLQLKSLEQFQHFQSGISQGTSFSTDKQRTAGELKELGAYFASQSQWDLTQMLIDSADIAGDESSTQMQNRAKWINGLPVSSVKEGDWHLELCRRAENNSVDEARRIVNSKAYILLSIDAALARNEVSAAKGLYSHIKDLNCLTSDEDRDLQEKMQRGEEQSREMVIDWSSAGSYIGKRMIVEGKIVVTKNIGNLCFLNFSSDFKGKFSVPVFKECFSSFPESPEEYFKNKTIRVTGKISVHRGAAQIEVHDPRQIIVLNAPIVDSDQELGLREPSVAITSEPLSTSSNPEEATQTIQENIFQWDKVDGQVGNKITVAGKVVVTKNIGNICFLNFTEDFKGRFSVPVFQECFDAWPESPEKYFKDKNLLVTGVVTIHKNAPQIEVHDASQISVVDSASTNAVAVSSAGAGAGESLPSVEDLPVISWELAKDHVGSNITAEGEVVLTKNIGNICFLNFVQASRGSFSVPLFRETFAAWKSPPETFFDHKIVRVSGKVSLHKGSPQIEVHSANQIQWLEEGKWQSSEGKVDTSRLSSPRLVISPNEAAQHAERAAIIEGVITELVEIPNGHRVRLEPSPQKSKSAALQTNDSSVAENSVGKSSNSENELGKDVKNHDSRNFLPFYVRIRPEANLTAIQNEETYAIGSPFRVSGRIVRIEDGLGVEVHDKNQFAKLKTAMVLDENAPKTSSTKLKEPTDIKDSKIGPNATP